MELKLNFKNDKGFHWKSRAAEAQQIVARLSEAGNELGVGWGGAGFCDMRLEK